MTRVIKAHVYLIMLFFGKIPIESTILAQKNKYVGDTKIILSFSSYCNQTFLS